VESYIINAHSLYVETLVEVGVIGLVLLSAFLLLLLGTAIWRAVRTQFATRAQAAGAAAACAAFLFSAGFDWIWQVPVLPVAMLLLLAAVLAPGPPPLKTAATVDQEARARTGGIRLGASRAALILAAIASLIAIGVPLATTNAVRQSQAAASAGNTSAALADARSAMRLEPGASSPQIQAALVLELQGRYSSAAAVARTATVNEPQNWQPWLILSRLEAEAGHARLAVDAYRRARASNPRAPFFQQ
jgi:tetratricopeptide (TPR) repeat protein